MAIFRLEAKIFSRKKKGRSIVAAAAYRAGMKLRDEAGAVDYDYSRREKGVLFSGILAPESAPKWATEPAQLWNTVEKSEKRKDAQLAREFVLSLPKELTFEQQYQLAVDWAKKELVSLGMVAEVSLHNPKSGKNPHAHILCTLRKLDGDKFSTKKAREWNDVKMLLLQRESWAQAVNSMLEANGFTARVDHRSLEARNIDRKPEPKIGVKDKAMQRRGAVEDTERCRDARQTRLLNEVQPMLNAINRTGAIAQIGLGRNWWERSSSTLARMRDQAMKLLKDSWQKFVRNGAKETAMER